VAVTWVTPDPPGVQTWPPVSHVPAQAKPAAAPPELPSVSMVSTAGLLDWKVTGAFTPRLPLSSAEAVNDSVAPMSRDPREGDTVIMAGTGVLGGVLLPPQPERASTKGSAMMTANKSPNLRMHPPRGVVVPGTSHVCAWKLLSVEAEHFFIKLRRLRGV
jgi:hypothetical protein